MQAILTGYAGKYSNPNLDVFYSQFPDLIKTAEMVIQGKLGLSPPPNDVIIIFGLDDNLMGPPMSFPTGFATQDRGNRHNIRISTVSVSNDFWGLTSTDKVITHELVHIYCMHYGGQRYANKPLWLKEGIALWTAGQTYEADFSKVSPNLRNGRWHEYLSYVINFQEALKTHTPQELLTTLLR